MIHCFCTFQYSWCFFWCHWCFRFIWRIRPIIDGRFIDDRFAHFRLLIDFHFKDDRASFRITDLAIFSGDRTVLSRQIGRLGIIPFASQTTFHIGQAFW